MGPSGPGPDPGGGPAGPAPDGAVTAIVGRFTVTAVRAERPPTAVTPVCRSYDPMGIVRIVMTELTKAGVEHEVRSVYRLAEAAARLLEQFDVEPVPVGVELAPVIPLQRRAADR